MTAVPNEAPTRILLISGSNRRGSTNLAALRTAAELAGQDVETRVFEGLGALPLFNPDDDIQGAEMPPTVAALRTAVGWADALMICTPEYAGALPAALKNLLEWTIGDAGTYGKPVAWINVSGPASPTAAADAHASLRKVLQYAGADIVDDATARIPLTREEVGADGLVSQAGAREALGTALGRLAVHAAAPRGQP